MSIPVKAGMTIGDQLSSVLNFGIVPSILMDSRTSIWRFGDGRFTQEESIDSPRFARKFDLGALAEIGTNYNIKSNLSISALFGYQQSFTSITNEEYFRDSKARHYGVYVSVGLKYALNKNNH